MHILSFVADTNHSSISGWRRKTTEVFHDHSPRDRAGIELVPPGSTIGLATDCVAMPGHRKWKKKNLTISYRVGVRVVQSNFFSGFAVAMDERTGCFFVSCGRWCSVFRPHGAVRCSAV